MKYSKCRCIVSKTHFDEQGFPFNHLSKSCDIHYPKGGDSLHLTEEMKLHILVNKNLTCAEAMDKFNKVFDTNRGLNFIRSVRTKNL
jgi:hypothetical protein